MPQGVVQQVYDDKAQLMLLSVVIVLMALVNTIVGRISLHPSLTIHHSHDVVGGEVEQGAEVDHLLCLEMLQHHLCLHQDLRLKSWLSHPHMLQVG